MKSDPLPLNEHFCLFSKLLITDSRSVHFYSKITQKLTFNENTAAILALVFIEFDFTFLNLLILLSERSVTLKCNLEELSIFKKRQLVS